MIFILFKTFIFVLLKRIKALFSSGQKDPGPNLYVFLALISSFIQIQTRKDGIGIRMPWLGERSIKGQFEKWEFVKGEQFAWVSEPFFKRPSMK